MPVHYEVRDRIAFISIEGRGPYNLFNPDQVYVPLKQTLLDFRDDPEVWVGVVSVPEEKKVFSYGGDLGSVSAIRNKSEDKDLHRGYSLGRERVFRPEFGTNEWGGLLQLGKLEIYKPIVFAIKGPCIAAAMLLVVALADFAIASPDTTFGLLAIKRAVGGNISLAQQLTQQLPWRISMDMILRGRLMDAEEALKYGFINQIAPREDLLSIATSIAEEIADNPPLHVQATKQMAIMGKELSPSAARFPGLLMSALLQTTPDAKEGPKAFMDKRKPNFTGRTDYL